MRVLQINVTCGIGSTGVIAIEIANKLKEKGHECYIAYGQGSTNYPNSYKIGGKFENKFHGLWNTRILGKEGTGTVCGTRKFLKWVDQISPDIIQIHNLHSNFLNFPMLFEYIRVKNIPVVYTLFDCWAFTGKCTHFTEPSCRKWESHCGNCPRLSSGPITWFFDRTGYLFDLKRKLFSNLPSLDIIVCSNWLKREVEKSFLANRPIHMIYNWIDTAKFKEIQDDTIYNRYGLDKKKKILVSVSAFWDDHTTRFEDAVRLARELPEDYQLVLIGKKLTDKPLLKNMIHVDYVNGVEELSKLYSSAIAFVGFSVEDTFGKVFAESMLCGTPAIVFASTACPEVVGDTGYAVPPHDVKSMVAKIMEISAKGRRSYSQRCIDKVITDYNYDQNVGKYIELYESIVARRNSNG